MKNKREKILARIRSACERSNRDLESVLLLAVSKKQPIKKIEEMIALGQTHFAENYVQEFLEKKENIKSKNLHWHLIGPLQSNKISKIIGEVELIHSVDSIKIAEILSEKAKSKNIIQNILLQINVAGEKTKSGTDTLDADHFIREAMKLSNLKIRGLMTMPPLSENAEDSRRHFRKLKEIAQKFKLSELSMGTTQDFEVAIEEGATIIRVGEALFGPRN